MIEALIHLIIIIVVVGIVAWLVIWLIDMLPMDGRFKQTARVLIAIVAVLIVLMNALPLLGVAI